MTANWMLETGLGSVERGLAETVLRHLWPELRRSGIEFPETIEIQTTDKLRLNGRPI
jgi:hypothetical protein